MVRVTLWMFVTLAGSISLSCNADQHYSVTRISRQSRCRQAAKDGRLRCRASSTHRNFLLRCHSHAVLAPHRYAGQRPRLGSLEGIFCRAEGGEHGWYGGDCLARDGKSAWVSIG
jgi:hypothetical protein